jgi:hypothetical protein
MEQMPSIPQKSSLGIDTRRRHHEGRPGVCQEQQRGPKQIRQEADRCVGPLRSRCNQPVPTIVIGDEQQRFSKKYEGVDRHKGFEGPTHVPHEAGIEIEKDAQHDTPDDGGHREGQEGDLGQIPRETVKPKRERWLSTAETKKFQQDAKNRQREDKTSEVGVELGDEPHDQPAV